jgi:hypothetical protein
MALVTSVLSIQKESRETTLLPIMNAPGGTKTMEAGQAAVA